MSGVDKPLPVAWLHTLHKEPGHQEKSLKFYADEKPFGQRGVDYDESYKHTAQPLYMIDDVREAIVQSAVKLVATKRNPEHFESVYLTLVKAVLCLPR